MPLHGNLYKAFKIFSYLNFHPNSKLVMNPERMYLEERFKSCSKENAEWFRFYGAVKEEILVGAPFPYGKYLEINYWVGADHMVDCPT